MKLTDCTFPYLAALFIHLRCYPKKVMIINENGSVGNMPGDIWTL